jgi:hypothetical protein
LGLSWPGFVARWAVSSQHGCQGAPAAQAWAEEGGTLPPKEPVMTTLFALGVWCLLLVLCWPLAILALLAWPVLWLLSLPLRLVGMTFSALFAFLRALLMLPARLLGGRALAT